MSDEAIMLSHYLPEPEVKRLTDSIRNRRMLADKIVWCFTGDGCNGKTTVAQHITSMVDGIHNLGDSVDFLSKCNMDYVILTVNSAEQEEKIKNICSKRGYVFLQFEFPYTFSSGDPSELKKK